MAEPSILNDSAVHLSVPATAATLRVVRLVAASLATDLDFGVDEIEDVRVAVDELAAVLLESADSPPAPATLDGRRLDLLLRADGGMIEVQGACEPPAAGEPVLHDVAAELLSLLVDDYEVGTGDDGRWWFRLRRTHRDGDEA